MEPSLLAVESEESLVDRAKKGDIDAFNEIVCRYQQCVIHVAYRLCGQIEMAEDAAQTAFISAWRHISSFRPQATFRAWLYRITINATLDLLRREKPSEDIDELPVPDPHPGMEDTLLERERQEQVRRAVLALPGASRSVLVLREYQGLSYQEIAQTLDIPLGTVMSRLSYARGRLTEILSPYLKEI